MLSQIVLRRQAVTVVPMWYYSPKDEVNDRTSARSVG